MSGRKAKINEFGQNLDLIREIVKPIWIQALKEEGISPRDAIRKGWTMGALVHCVAEDMRKADQKN